MNRFSVGTVRQQLDDWRVRQHFKRVEAILRNRDISHLPPALQQAREHYLDQLHTYAARGVFPRNYERPGYAPCFIDRDGRECAVANLVMTSGQDELAHTIAGVANYAYVSQMSFPELDKWTAQAGLNKEELALIQPGYWYTFSGSLLSIGSCSMGSGNGGVCDKCGAICPEKERDCDAYDWNIYCCGFVASKLGLPVWCRIST